MDESESVLAVVAELSPVVVNQYGNVPFTAYYAKSTTGDLFANPGNGDSTGLLIWAQATDALCHLITKLDLSSQSILELGSGCGVCGLLCLAQGAKFVEITDGNANIIENQVRRSLLEMNLAPERYRARELVWGQQQEEEEQFFSLVIGSDVIYPNMQEKVLQALCDTIFASLPSHHEGRFTAAPPVVNFSQVEPCAVLSFVDRDYMQSAYAFYSTAIQRGLSIRRLESPQSLGAVLLGVFRCVEVPSEEFMERVLPGVISKGKPFVVLKRKLVGLTCTCSAETCEDQCLCARCAVAEEGGCLFQREHEALSWNLME